MEPSLTKKLLNYLKTKSISDTDRQRAALHVLDWLACCSLAKKSAVASVYQSYIQQEIAQQLSFSSNQEDNSQPCNIVFGQTCYWQDALLINGALGNVLEMDDIHRSSILHPGPVVIPAALAIAQKHKLSMRNFLNSIVLGYEITIRLGESIGRSHYQYFHNTATCAAMGASLAVSHLLGLSIEQAVNALGNVGSRTGGLWQMRNENVLTKQWHNSEAAKVGTMASLLAKQGLTGPEYILEGPQGIFVAMSSDAKPELFIKPSVSWRLFDCSFKPWPACRHAHPAIDAVITALSQSSTTVLATDIKLITISTYKDAKVFCDKPSPETELQAKFSIQHAVAAVITWGEPQLSHYHEDNHSQLSSIRALVQINEDETIESQYPYHFGAKCEIVLQSGKTLSAHLTDTLGDPERPLSAQQLKDKANMLMSAAKLDNETISELVSMKWAQKSQLDLLTSLITSNQ
jgi:2-methylcitrate dehydratase PrpD